MGLAMSHACVENRFLKLFSHLVQNHLDIFTAAAAFLSDFSFFAESLKISISFFLYDIFDFTASHFIAKAYYIVS